MDFDNLGKKLKVEVVGITQPLVDGIKTPDQFIAYCARVSNPGNQMNTLTAPKLISYCIKKNIGQFLKW